MQKKLVSILSVMTVLSTVPAMSATNEVNGGPTELKDDANYSGYYKSDTEYKNAANATNLGSRYTTDGAEFDLLTEWTEDKYTVNPGYYLPANGDDEDIAECDNGYYCPGSTGAGFTFSSSDQGIEACPDGFTNSDENASTESQCYRACTPSMVANATGVKGNDYYGEDTADTCEPTSCAAGWHIKEGQSVNISETIGTKAGTNSAYINNTGSFGDSGSQFGAAVPQSFWNFGAEDKNVWGVNFGDSGMVKGQAQCSSKSGTGAFTGATTPEEVSTATTLPDSKGRYCWCNLTGYKAADGAEMSLSSPWVSSSDRYSAANCASACANTCAGNFRDDRDGGLRLRSALFGSVGASTTLTTLASCEANKYKLNWKGTDGTTTITTETKYNGSITSPKDAPEKKGHTFKGWKLQKSATTND